MSSNVDSARKAAEALALYDQSSGPDCELRDLLTDLMHFCDVVSLADFDKELEAARANYLVESTDPLNVVSFPA